MEVRTGAVDWMGHMLPSSLPGRPGKALEEAMHTAMGACRTHRGRGYLCQTAGARLIEHEELNEREGMEGGLWGVRAGCE